MAALLHRTTTGMMMVVVLVMLRMLLQMMVLVRMMRTLQMMMMMVLLRTMRTAARRCQRSGRRGRCQQRGSFRAWRRPHRLLFFMPPTLAPFDVRLRIATVTGHRQRFGRKELNRRTRRAHLRHRRSPSRRG